MAMLDFQISILCMFREVVILYSILFYVYLYDDAHTL